jgi:hypothetical protein
MPRTLFWAITGLCLILALPGWGMEVEEGVSLLAKSLSAKMATAGLKRVGVPEFTGVGKTAVAEARPMGGAIGATGHYLAERLTGSLANCANERYAIVERARLNRVLEEGKFQASGLTDPTTSKELLGKIPGLDGLVDGSVSVNRVTREIEVQCRVIAYPGCTVCGSAGVTIELTPNLLALFPDGYLQTAEVHPPKALVTEAFTPNYAPAPETDPQSPFGLEILAGGASKAVFRDADRHLYVGATAGEVFSVRLINRSTDPVAVALYLDGKNCFTFKPDLPEHASKWVLLPRSELLVKGWQLETDVARQFVFSLTDDSTATRTRYSSGVGLIKAIFYPAITATDRGGLEIQPGDKIPSPTVAYKGEFLRTPTAQLAVRYDHAPLVTKLQRMK